MEGVSAPTNPIRQTLLALLRPNGVWRNEQAARQRADKCTSINHSITDPPAAGPTLGSSSAEPSRS